MMATLESRDLMRRLQALRYEPTPKRVRALAGGEVWVDSRRAVIVWEPKRIVPCYAVPDDDIDATLLPVRTADAVLHPVAIGPGSPPVLDPRTAFAAHTCDGQPLSLKRDTGRGAAVLDGAGFRPVDPDLHGHVLLDFAIFDQWLEEDEPIVGHPRDPFKRIDVRRSSGQVRVEVDGVVVATTNSALVLFETMLPPRFYIPRDDVRMDLLVPSPTRSTCAYKGHASYWSVEVNGQAHRDLAWTYEEPLSDAVPVAGYVTFFNERVDISVDGKSLDRPVTPWS